MASKKKIILLSILIAIIMIGIIIVPIILSILPGDKYLPESGPYHHDIYHATSSDGLNWTVNKTLLFDHASVPGAVHINGSIYVYFVNAASGEKLSVAISDDNGSTYTIHDVSISGSNSPRPVDPNAIIDKGKIRLTYLGNLMQSGEEHKIVTAISTDGINFIEEAVIFSEDSITDPDLFKNSTGDWVLFVNNGSQLIKATNSSVLGNFSIDYSFSFSGGWLASTHKIGGKYYTYLHNGLNISVAEYNSSGLTILKEDLISGFEGIVGDPTVAILGPGNYIMYFKTCIIC
ncbi:MAG: hypothetical protein GF329_15030 [Candidatus Lokiarchaeota archaeon]|nr:hypothetical protein [Candidatus Lokiarchaeota archaeon]